MKILFLLALSVLFIVAFTASNNLAYASGICCLVKVQTDRAEYGSDETVNIDVDIANFKPSGTTTLRITDASDDLQGTKTVYEQQGQMSQGHEIFTYKIPHLGPSDPYRYHILVDTPAGTGHALFFTKSGASKIVISDFTVYTPQLKPGQGLSFTAKIVDGLGNPIPYLAPTANILYYPTGNYTYFSAPINYNPSSNLYDGWYIMPTDLEGSKYYLQLSILNDAYSGFSMPFEYPQSEKREFEVLSTGVIQACTKWQSASCTPLDEIVVKDVKIRNNPAKQGEVVKFDIDTTDKYSHPVNILMGAVLKYQDCWGATQTNSIGGYNESASVFNGELTVQPNTPPGNYTVELSSDLPEGTRLSGIKQFNIQVNPDEESYKQVNELFDQYSSKMGHNTFGEGDIIHFTGRTIFNTCSTPLSNQPVDFTLDGTTKDNHEKIFKKQIVSGPDGRYDIPLNMTDLNLCSFGAKVSSVYKGFNETRDEFDFTMHNLRDYPIHAEGKDFTIHLDAGCSIPTALTFDQQNKKITLKASTPEAEKSIIVSFPHELLDGNLTAYANGNMTDSSIYKDPDKATVTISTAISGNTVYEIVGTSAIPEFPFVVPLLLISFVSLLLFYRIKLEK